jgi:hypothetical protein
VRWNSNGSAGDGGCPSGAGREHLDRGRRWRLGQHVAPCAAPHAAWALGGRMVLASGPGMKR